MAVDQLNFLIYEPVGPAKQVLRQTIMGFAMRQDVDVQMDWLVKPEHLEHIPQLAPQAHFALLSADDLPHSVEAGKRILQANPQCAIVYYGRRTGDLAQYFPARPIRYLEQPATPQRWEQILGELHDQLRHSTEYFCWTSKFCRYFIPCSRILVMRSGGGSLDIHLTDGTVHTLTAKLDEAQKRLPSQDFLRVHKSALVNIHQVRVMDRSDKSLLLSDGSKAYISKAHYKDVAQTMETMMGCAVQN